MSKETPRNSKANKSMWLGLGIIVALGLWLRLMNIHNRPLWLDEISSLIVATGHTWTILDGNQPVPPGSFVSLASFSNETSIQNGPKLLDVLQANATNNWMPPVYPVLAHIWMSVLGATDATLRYFSLAWWLASLPLIWLIGRRVGGLHAAFLLMLAAAVHPTAVHYGVEGRNYSIMMFFATALLWLTLRLHDKGGNFVRTALWAATAAGGILVHYFFIPTAAACGIWLSICPGKLDKRLLAVAGAAAIGLVLPWYALAPRLFAETASVPMWFLFPVSLDAAATGLLSIIFWQIGDSGTSALAAVAMVPLSILWAAVFTKQSFLSDTRVVKGVAIAAIPLIFLARPFPLIGPTVILAATYLIGYGLSALLFRATINSKRRRDVLALLYLVIASACAAPLATYLAAGGRLILCQRYYLCALLPCLLLLVLALTKLKPVVRMPVLASLLAIWFCLSFEDSQVPPMEAQGYLPIVTFIDRQPQTFALLFDVMHEDVIGITRKLSTPRSTAYWYNGGVDFSTLKASAEMKQQLNGRSGVVLVQNRQTEWQSQWPNFQSPPLRWLKANARMVSEFTGNNLVYVFVPKTGDTFSFPSEPTTHLGPVMSDTPPGK